MPGGQLDTIRHIGVVYDRVRQLASAKYARMVNVGLVHL